MATLMKCGGLFLHVPKTGGNWVSQVLEDHDLVFAHVGGKHAGLRQLAPLLRLLHTPRRYDRANRPLFTFCFVRHPLRWYESWYRMNAALGWADWASDEDAWNPSVELNGFGAATFNGFIENVLRRRPGFLTRLYDYYARDAHFVGRQEHMREDLVAVLRFLNVPFEPAHVFRARPVNVSDPADVRLDPGLRQAVEEAEGEAYARYGYTTQGLTEFTPSVFIPSSSGSNLPVPGPFTPDEGHAWRLGVPELSRFADSEEDHFRSMLAVLENGRPLPFRHAMHEDVRRLGNGRFSHWKEMVLFSTSDNSNPNENGRRYELGWRFPAAEGATHLMLTVTSPAAAVA